MNDTPKPDADAMLAHLLHLFGDYAGDGKIELAWTDEAGRLSHGQPFGAGEIDELVAKAVEVNAGGRNVYVGAALRKPDIAPFGRCTDDDFLCGTACYADLDAVGAAQKAKDRYKDAPATLIVVTGRAPWERAQLWWRLDDPIINADEYRRLNTLLAAAFDGDKAVVNPSRVMRLGGSIAWPAKPGRVVELTELVQFNGTRSALGAARLEGVFSITFQNEKNSESPDNSTIDLGLGVDAPALLRSIGPGSWHQPMLRFVGHCVGAGYPDWVILAAAHPYLAKGTQPRTLADIQTMINGARKKLKKPNGTMPATEVTRRVADIEREEIEWLWPARIPLGKLSIISGDPGLGKSMVTLFMAAVVSNGGQWPIAGEGSAPLGAALIVSAEDDPADTLRPRLEAAGADLERVHVLDHLIGEDGKPRPWTLADLPALEHILARLPDTKLIVIDPVSAFLAGADSHKNSDIRALLAPVAKLAGEHGVAIVAVSHLNKSGEGRAIYRTSGSLAFVAAARCVYGISRDKDDRERRLFIPIKHNLARDIGGLAFRIEEDDTGAPRIVWEPDVIEIDPDTALSEIADEARTDREEAEDWLRERLAGGPVAVKDIKAEAANYGFSPKTLQRARREIGATVAKTEFEGGWTWSR